MPQPQTGHVPKRFSLLRENSSSLPLAASRAGLGEGVGPPGISRDAGRSRPVAASRKVSIIVLIALWAFFAAGPALHAQEASVGLGTADDFAVLGGTTITNTGPTTITGDVGLDPASVTGFDSVTLNGDLHQTDAVAQQAKDALVTAYNDAAGRTVTGTIPTELGGQTLTGGV